jgi:two-component system LytT family response regulator
VIARPAVLRELSERRVLSRGRERRPASWAVRSRGRITLVRHAEIDWVQAEGDYVRLHAGARSFLVRETMAGAARRLDSRRFARIHRSAIVNVDRIRDLAPLENGVWSVRLQDGRELRLSRTYRRAFDRLTGRG